MKNLASSTYDDFFLAIYPKKIEKKTAKTDYYNLSVLADRQIVKRMLLVLILVVVMMVGGDPICGFQKTSMVGSSMLTCNHTTNKEDCSKMLNADTVSYTDLETEACVWVTSPIPPYISTCTPSQISCMPTCFVNGKTQNTGVTACSAITNPTICDNSYIGGFGNSKICLYDGAHSICKSEYCDYTCTGTNQKTTSCPAYTNRFECESHYYDDGTRYKNCEWTGSACAIGETCIKRCSGIQNTTSCSTWNNNIIACAMAYEIDGIYTADCVYNTATAVCSSKYPQNCYYQPPAQCAGTAGTGGFGTSCAATFTSQAACNNGYVFDDTLRQCEWNVGANRCDNGLPCKNT